MLKIIIIIAVLITAIFRGVRWYKNNIYRFVQFEQSSEFDQNYATDFKSLSDIVQDTKSHIGIMIADDLVRRFKHKYAGSAYLEYDIRKLKKQIELKRAIYHEELIMN